MRNQTAPGRWLERIRRRPVVGVFLLAFLARAAVAVVLTAAVDGVIAPDEAVFREMAGTVAAGESLEEGRFGPTFQVTRFYVSLLAALYRLFGPELIVGRLLAALLGAGVAAAVTALASQLVQARYALIAGGVVALLPSQVFFSAQTLKDALVWLLVATIAVTMAKAAQGSEPRHLVVLLLVAATALALLGMVRAQTTAVAALALGLGGWCQGRGRARILRGVAAGLVAAAVPAAIGLGPLALGILRQVDDTPGIRSRHAEAGETPFVDPDATPVEQAIAGLQAYTTAPTPWQPTRQSWEPLAQLETMVWYPLLLLAGVGLWSARRHLEVLAFPALYLGGTIVVYSLASGDLMTAYRHRGEIVWPVALMAGLAIAQLRFGARRAARRMDR